jgi:hypothetical protein
MGDGCTSDGNGHVHITKTTNDIFYTYLKSTESSKIKKNKNPNWVSLIITPKHPSASQIKKKRRKEDSNVGLSHAHTVSVPVRHGGTRDRRGKYVRGPGQPHQRHVAPVRPAVDAHARGIAEILLGAGDVIIIKHIGRRWCHHYQAYWAAVVSSLSRILGSGDVIIIKNIGQRWCHHYQAYWAAVMSSLSSILGSGDFIIIKHIRQR